MQLTIDVKDSVLDKVLYLLEHLKNDVKIVAKEENSCDTLSSKELKKLQDISKEYKDGYRDNFEEYHF